MLEGSENIPTISLNQKTGVFEISGRSLPSDAAKIYAPVLSWIEQYSKHPNPVTDLIFKLEYLNTGSSKIFLDIFYALQQVNGARVTWCFLEDDEDMEETGEEFAQLVKLPFELKAY